MYVFPLYIEVVVTVDIEVDRFPSRCLECSVLSVVSQFDKDSVHSDVQPLLTHIAVLLYMAINILMTSSEISELEYPFFTTLY